MGDGGLQAAAGWAGLTAPWSGLFEREAELELLQALLEGSGEGRAAVAVVEGEAGIGKTALVRAVQAAARARGIPVCSATCHELERGFALGVARQVFEPVLRATGAEERTALCAGAAHLGAEALSDRTLQGTFQTDAAVSFATLHGLYWLTANLTARSPLLITVDDVQWADEPSRRWLIHLVRRLGGLPVLVVLSVNPGEPGARDALAILGGGDVTERVLRPGRLGLSTVALLVRQTLGGDAAEEFCAACHAATGGNPFLLRELLRELSTEGVAPTAAGANRVPAFGPSAVARSLRARLERISPAASALARAVTVLGEPVQLALAARLADLDEHTAATAADMLGQIGVFQEQRPLAFVSPIFGSAVYRDLPASIRSALHLRAARLVGDAAPGLAVPVERIAAHLLATEPARDAWTPGVLHSAAASALGRGAPEVASAYLARALREPPPDALRAELLVQLGQLKVPTDPAAAIEYLELGMELTADPRVRVRAAGGLTRALGASGRSLDAVRVVERVLAGLQPADAQLGLRLENTLIAAALFILPTTAIAQERLERGQWQPPPVNSPARRARQALRAIVAAWRGESAATTLELAGQGLVGDVLSDDEEEALMRLVAVGALLDADDLGLAEHHCDQALDVSVRRGWLFLHVTARYIRAQVLWRRGAIMEALADAKDALDLAGPQIGALTGGLAVAGLINVLLERGQFSEASTMLERHGLTGELPEVWQSNHLLFSRGRLRMAQGQVRAGLLDLLEAGRRMEAFGAVNPAVMPWRAAAALACTHLGEHERAHRLATDEVALARGYGAPRATGIALRVAGSVTQTAEGMDLLHEAVAVLEPTPFQIELARALTALGERMCRTGRQRDAREHFRRALDVAQRCTATVLAARAYNGLLAAGARPRRLQQSGRHALTPSEHRIAAMVVGGQTNREIAEALFVTQRTVELHLTTVYRKLGISGRSQIAAALSLQP